MKHKSLQVPPLLFMIKVYGWIEDEKTNLSSKFQLKSLTRRDREVVDFTQSRVKNYSKLTNLGN